jgi:Ca2+-binding EF-hand superfamily protein
VESQNDYEATFSAIDTDGDGLIGAAELQGLMTSLGESLSDDAANTMLGFIDADGDGKVTRLELANYLSGR